MTSRIPARVAAVLMVILSGVGSLLPTAVTAQEQVQYLTEPAVVVSRLGAVRASGMVDCSADVLAMWPGYEGAPDLVLTNVSWTANQRRGRSVITATFEDHQASPCWARPGAPWVEPGRCRTADDGTLHPCRWDSANYGSDGWVFGNGAFRTGTVHVAATMDGGHYSLPDDEYLNLGSFAIAGWELNATRG